MKKITKNNFIGIMFMLSNAVFMSILYSSVKLLTKDLPSSFVVFAYKFLVMLLVIPVALYRGGLKTKVFHVHCLRGIFSVVGALLMFYALKFTDLLDVTALGYLEQCLLMIIGIVFLNERASKSKIISIFSCLTGAFLIVYKEFLFIDASGNIGMMDHFPIKDLNKYHLLIFTAVVIWALNRLLVRVLGRTERSEVQLFYVSFFSSLVAFPWAFYHCTDVNIFGVLPMKLPTTMMTWQEIGLAPQHIYYFLLLVVCYGLHSVFTFKALQYADLSVVVPFEYTRLLFSAILGYLLFAELPNFSAYVGCFLILASGALMVGSEKRYSNRQKRREQQVNIMEDEV